MSPPATPDDAVLRTLRALSAEGPPVPVPELVTQLHRVNAALWRLEDEARAAADDEQLGRAKREVDRQNMRRADLVSEIDRVVAAVLPSGRPETAPLSCSVGASLDRLTVAALRVAVFAAAGDHRTVDARRQLDDLRAATEADWLDLRRGRRRLPQAGVLKRYAPRQSSTAPA
ncbi:DUF4254 domain-containing protein [Plantactinospora sp. KLBMP9567]|uniref:DUF4254 domain-containing protein n=1 Tax=Plantactinospora sp. KLBMP9567 TaxID=3085900 RepID=UPI00298264AA|nr:DUF4254 domain-containing protein [Plantactinospora sp. KLBMP9567]MDW5324875.1 DUF4254 domain-containing protein [Plantactinospora sp. KLBMP9567]